MCGYACIGFIGSMLKGKNLLDYFLLTKKSKISYICDKTLFLSSICNNCGSEDKKIFKVEESIRILKILGLINNM